MSGHHPPRRRWRSGRIVAGGLGGLALAGVLGLAAGAAVGATAEGAAGIAIRPELLRGQAQSVSRAAIPVGNAPTRLTTSLLPADGAVVGVGHPVILTLSRPVEQAGRAAVEERLRVSVNGAPARGDWGWMTDSEVWFRPHQFWPGSSEVVVEAELAGVAAGAFRSRPLTGGLDQDRRWSFRTGPAVISYVDGATYEMVVTVDGLPVRTIPVSLGKVGFETRDGVKVVAEKYETKRMTSEGQDLPEEEEYDVEVAHAARLTWTGEFVHAAPWASHRLGRAHGSHGCVNVSAADAKWFYDNAATPGDVVVFVNAGPPMELWNGYGGPWNLTVAQWRARSSLAVDSGAPPGVPDRLSAPASAGP